MIRTILTLLGPGHGRAVATHLVLSVVSVLARAASALLLVPLVAALFGGEPATAWPWVGALVAVTVVGWLVDWAVNKIAFELGFSLLESGQQAVADRLARVRLTWFDAENTSAARQAIAACGPDLVGLIVYLVTPLLGALVLPAAIAAGLFFVAWPLGVVALLGVPLLFGAYLLAGRLGRDADATAAAANATLTERIVEFARTQHALRAARRVDPERSAVGSALAAQHGAAVNQLVRVVPGQVLFTLVSQLVLAGLAGVTVWLTLTSALSLPQAVALIVVIVRYLEPFTVLAQLAPGVEGITAALRTLHSVMQAPLNPAPATTAGVGVGARSVGGHADVGSSHTGAHPVASDHDGSGPDLIAAGREPEPGRGVQPAVAAVAPRVELRDVSFAYGPGEASVLDGFSLTLEPGTTTAIVGPSGSGKSTVLTLLAGLHAPVSGSILVDGVDAATLDADARHDLVSVVFQHPYLFDGVLADNVALGRPDATPEQIADAGRLARLESFVHRHPDGWQARVGEGGGLLSGGERQRASIARALLKPAPILLVDEATSALDTENERAVTLALTLDPTPRTRVVVTHRLSTLDAVDRVVFLEDGTIVEDGTTESLLAAGGRFAEFWSQQHAAGAWRLGVR